MGPAPSRGGTPHLPLGLGLGAHGLEGAGARRRLLVAAAAAAVTVSLAECRREGLSPEGTRAGPGRGGASGASRVGPPGAGLAEPA